MVLSLFWPKLCLAAANISTELPQMNKVVRAFMSIYPTWFKQSTYADTSRAEEIVPSATNRYIMHYTYIISRQDGTRPALSYEPIAIWREHYHEPQFSVSSNTC